MLTWLLILALLWPLFWALRVGAVAKLLLGLEFKRERIAPFPPDQVPEHLAEAARPWQAQLESIGFRLLGGWRAQRFSDPSLDEIALVFAHASAPVRAIVQPHGNATLSGRCWVNLRTTTAAGIEIVTSAYEPEELVSRPAGLAVEFIDDAPLPVLWERHLARIASEQATAWAAVDLEAAAAREQLICDAVFAHLCAQPEFAPLKDGALTYRVRPAVARARRVLQTAVAKQKVEHRKAQTEPAGALSVGAQTTFDLQHYRQLVALTRGRMSRRTKAIITMTSFLLFAAVLGWTMSPVISVSLVVALIIHECGHLLGMRWFGHRDTQLLFVPFFGGAAIAHDEKILAPWKHIVIILLGPLPGIFLGLAFYVGASGGPDWLQKAALTAIVMNAFNLLPILPLDGGQIVDYAFASRFPRIRVLFVALSALGLVLIGMGLDVLVLTILGGLTLLRLPVEFKLARVRRDVRRALPGGGDEEPVVRRLLERFRAADWTKTPMAQRLVMIRGLQQVLRMPKPGFGTMCFAALGYMAPLWMGVPIALWGTYRQGQTVVRAAAEKVRAAGIDQPRPVTKTAAVAADDNGAVLYARAAAILNEASSDARSTRSAEIVELLQAAATKRAFVSIDAADKSRESGSFGVRAYNTPLSVLNHAATEKLRYGEPQAAMALVRDNLRLIRLLDTAPGMLNQTARRVSVEASLNTLEEILAAGALPAGEESEQISVLLDERHEFAIAARDMPKSVLAEARYLDEIAERAGKEAWHFWSLVAQMYPHGAQARARLLEEAIVLDGELRKIQAGKWPALPVAGGADMHRSTMALVELADLMARMKQARVAVAVIRLRSRGNPVASLDAAQISADELRHPWTAEPMRMIRRGSIDVLAFQGMKGRLYGGDVFDAVMAWRLPVPLAAR